MVTYGTNVIPSDQITVLSGGTVAVSVAFENSIGLIGGMDTANGSATPGDVVEVASPSDAQSLFGEGSELHEQAQIAFNNNASTVYALPVTETQTTESFSSTSSGTLGNVPAMDPNVHDEHSITVQDTVAATSVDVNFVYDTPTQPSTTDTMNLNPVTGSWAADASSDYDITYTYGDYSAAAIAPLLDESPRIVVALTENVSAINDLMTEINARASNFDFMQAVAGASPSVDPANYTDSIGERRLSLVYPSRGYIDAAETDEHRTMGAVGGELASLALGLSSTNNEIDGFTDLAHTPSNFGPSDAGDLIDEQVLPLLDYPPITIVKDMTTSTEPKFERVFTMQVVDEATEVSHQISREYVGDQNTAANRRALKQSHVNAYNGFLDGTPRLADDYTIEVAEDGSDPNVVNVNIGLDPVDVMDTIDVTITVGNIVRNGGAN